MSTTSNIYTVDVWVYMFKHNIGKFIHVHTSVATILLKAVLLPLYLVHCTCNCILFQLYRVLIVLSYDGWWLGYLICMYINLRLDDLRFQQLILEMY